jgi:hypothetical protein
MPSDVLGEIRVTVRTFLETTIRELARGIAYHNQTVVSVLDVVNVPNHDPKWVSNLEEGAMRNHQVYDPSGIYLLRYVSHKPGKRSIK